MMAQTCCIHTHTHTWGQVPSFSCEVRQWLSRWQNNEYLYHPKIPMVRQAYQAGPALISQLAILEAPMSFHPDHSGLSRGHVEFKGYSPHTAVILPTGVYFHHTDQCFRHVGEGLFVLQDWNVDCGENKHPTGVLRWYYISAWTA